MSDFKPMSEFDPTRPAIVHDVLNDRTMVWNPEEHLDSYRRFAEPDGPTMVAWDGYLLDGWKEPEEALS